MNPLWNRETAKGAFHVFRPCGRIALFLLFFFAKAHAGGIPSDLKAVHLLNRLAFGPRAGEVTRVHDVGVERYIREQLSPEAMDLPSSLMDRLEALPTLRLTPGELFAEYNPPPAAKTKDKESLKRAQQRARIPLEEASEARILRAVNSPRQLQEVMVNFWFNHFNVFAGKGLDRLWVGAYEEQAIRPHALGRFRELLGATAKHPAMLFYLDNWLNTAPGSRGARGRFKGLNENYARELMELHTLGVDGGYTQEDVISLARILTGWTFRRQRDSLSARPESAGSGFSFDASRHDVSDKIFVGQFIRGSGLAEGEQALDILARSPATARRVSFRLAQYFIADRPPASAVDRLARRFLETDGDIRSVLETLFHSPEFWDQGAFGTKFKTPYEFVVSAVRATGAEVGNARPLAGLMQQLGMPLYGCQTPDGYKNTREAWLNPGAMTQRVSFATAMGTGAFRLHQTPFGERSGAGGTAPAGSERGGTNPPDFSELRNTLGGHFSARTNEAVAGTPARLQAAVILGSPDFMHR